MFKIKNILLNIRGKRQPSYKYILLEHKCLCLGLCLHYQEFRKRGKLRKEYNFKL